MSWLAAIASKGMMGKAIAGAAAGSAAAGAAQGAASRAAPSMNSLEGVQQADQQMLSGMSQDADELMRSFRWLNQR